MNKLGLTYNSQGRYDEARKLYENALAGLEEHRGERDRDVLATMANLGSCYDSLGLFDQAETLLAVWEQDFGNDHPATLNVYVLLGEMYHVRG
jgi:tetratricopeptide (TPR) repeat protein